MNANQRLEDKEKALLNAEGEVAALNRRISNLEEELEKTEDRFVFCNQSHYREVAQWEIFMEQELRFGLDLGRRANFPAFIASKSFDL